MNNLPPQFFTDNALTKRLALIHFDQQIRPEDIDTNFIANIIAHELPGVLNWIIQYGLDPLLETGRLDPPPCCVAEMERIRQEVDPLSAWLVARDYQRGTAHRITFNDAYKDFVKFCGDNGYTAPGNKTVSKRLRELGYTFDCVDHSIGLRFYYSKSVPKNGSVRSDDSELPEDTDEINERHMSRRYGSGEVPF